jgi:hypothetical protein
VREVIRVKNYKTFKAMKKIFTIIMLCGVVCGYAQNTPSNAASTIIWVIGEQSWSNAIRMPECHKETFEEDHAPQCRSYTEEGKTWYYYNWAYVDKYKAKMCPSPWRVPTKADMETLESNSNGNALFDAWGYGGYAFGSSMYDVNSYDAYYWSSTEYDRGFAYNLYFSTSGGVGPQKLSTKLTGLQVRCVK